MSGGVAWRVNPDKPPPTITPAVGCRRRDGAHSGQHLTRLKFMLISAARFWAKVDKTGDCWLWMGSLDSKDRYGQVRIARRLLQAHRVAWELLIGPIPEGMELDHHNSCPKRCVRPDHLRQVTHKQNGEHRRGANRNNRSTGIRGVYWDCARNRWKVLVKHNYVIYFGGRFDRLDEAEQAAANLRLRLHTLSGDDHHPSAVHIDSSAHQIATAASDLAAE